MSGSLEEAYVAVERAYGQGDFAGALQLADALRPQVPPGRPDLLDQRLQLLLGHIHLYGLNQPAEAAAAYTAVMEGCTEPSYRELAGQGLEISRQQLAVAPEPEPAVQAEMSAPTDAGTTAPTVAAATAGQPLPATPWLNQLQDPQQALSQIQQAWATATPAPAAVAVATPAATAGGTAATPWGAGGATTTPVEPSTPAAMVDEPPAAAEPVQPEAPADAGEEPIETAAAAAPESSDLAVQLEEARDSEPEDPQAIIPVVVTVEDDEASTGQEPAAELKPEAAAAPEVEAPDAFSEEEWADFKRGLLLVELTTSNAGPTR